MPYNTQYNVTANNVPEANDLSLLVTISALLQYYNIINGSTRPYLSLSPSLTLGTYFYLLDRSLLLGFTNEQGVTEEMKNRANNSILPLGIFFPLNSCLSLLYIHRSFTMLMIALYYPILKLLKSKLLLSRLHDVCS